MTGNWAGLSGPETGPLNPGVNSDFDLRSLSANRTGPLPANRTHSLKLYGAKEFEISSRFAVLVGLTYEGVAGTPVSYLGAHPTSGLNEVFILPRGAAGETQWVHTVNAKVGATYFFTPTSGLQLTVDLLNLFNLRAVTEVDQTLTSATTVPVTVADGADPSAAICLSGNNPGCVSQAQKVNDETGALSPLAPGDLNRNFKRPTAYQLPLQVRVGLKFFF